MFYNIGPRHHLRSSLTMVVIYDHNMFIAQAFENALQSKWTLQCTLRSQAKSLSFKKTAMPNLTLKNGRVNIPLFCSLCLEESRCSTKWHRRWIWRINEMMHQQNDASTKWRISEMTHQWNDTATKWCINEMTHRWNDAATKWRSSEMTQQRNDASTKWHINKMTHQWNDATISNIFQYARKNVSWLLSIQLK